MSIEFPLTTDLPENWENNQTVAPTGEQVGLTTQHGYNYLMNKVNEVRAALNQVNTQVVALSGTVNGMVVARYKRQYIANSTVFNLTDFNNHSPIYGFGEELGVNGALNYLDAIADYPQRESLLFSMVINSNAERTVTIRTLHNYNSLMLYINGVKKEDIGGGTGVHSFSEIIPSGDVVIQWLMNKSDTAGTPHCMIADWFVEGITWLRAATS